MLGIPLVALGMLAGCSEATPMAPNADQGALDSGFRDSGPGDAGGDLAVVPMDLGGSDGAVLDGGSGDGGSSADAGTDAGVVIDSGPAGASPQIVNVAWEVAPDGSCVPSSGLRFVVVVTDADTNTFNLDAQVTGMGSCFFFGATKAPDMIEVNLSNCPHDRDYTPTITITDPEGHSDSISGFTVMPCSSGAFFP
jgi:hypothetical protein